MDSKTVRQNVATWPVADRIELIEQVWEDIAEFEHGLDLTPSQSSEIDRRVQWLDANPDKTISWEAVEAFARESR